MNIYSRLVDIYTYIYMHTYLDGFSLHAHAQTLLVAAVLTSVALAFIDYTVLVFSACI